MKALRAASADLQNRARSMNSITLDNMNTNSNMLVATTENTKRFNNAAIHAAHMAIDVVRGR